MQDQSERVSLFWVLTFLLLTNLGARYFFIHSYGSFSPNWDEWQAHGVFILKRYMEGDLALKDFFVPHNEHRIVLTRLYTLGLFKLNNHEWNTILEMRFNAIIFSAGMTAFFALCTYNLSKITRIHLSVMFLVLICIPFAWENLLNGFQSQFYFAVIFSLTALFFFRKGSSSKLELFCGLISLLLGYLSFTTAIFVTPALVATWLVSPPDKKRNLVYIIISVLLFVIMYYLLPDSVSEKTYATSIYSLIISFCRFLAFPYTTIPLFSIIIYSPTLLLVYSIFRGNTKTDDSLRYLLSVSFFTILISAAIAYGRGGDGSGPSPRYLDLLIPGIFVNIVMLVRLKSTFTKKAFIMIKYGYAFFILAGATIFVSLKTIPQLNKRKVEANLWENTISQYLETKDKKIILNASQDKLPFPVGQNDEFMKILDDETIIDLLPLEKMK